MRGGRVPESSFHAFQRGWDSSARGCWGCSARKTRSSNEMRFGGPKASQKLGLSGQDGSPARDPCYSQGAPGTPSFPFHPRCPHVLVGAGHALCKAEGNRALSFSWMPTPAAEGAKCSPVVRVASLPSPGLGSASDGASLPQAGRLSLCEADFPAHKSARLQTGKEHKEPGHQTFAPTLR